MKKNIDKTIREQKLIREALEKLRATTGLNVRITQEDYPIARGRRADAIVEIPVGIDAVQYLVEYKARINKATLGVVAHQLKNAEDYEGLLITDYVNPLMAEQLKGLGIAFLDLAGNAYLNKPPLYVYIKGNRLTDKKALGMSHKPTRAFQTTGLKVLFGFITQPILLNATYRDIARATGVARGTVGWVMTDLREHGYLYEIKAGERRIIKRRELIDQWVIAYPDKLRQKLRLGRYRAERRDWWRNVDITKHDAQWGGEVAAAKLTKYLVPDRATIYATAIPPQLLLEYHLKKDPEGDVEILERFWKPMDTQKTPTNERPDLVPTVLTYADLMATADDRNLETARIIYDEHLDGHI